MITDTQKETINDLKSEFKKLNSSNSKKGRYIDVNSIIGANQEGKIRIEEIKLRNKVFKEHGKDILKAFSVRIKDDFDALGLELKFMTDSVLRIQEKGVEYDRLADFRIATVTSGYESINGDQISSIIGYEYSIQSFRDSSVRFSKKGFEELMKLPTSIKIITDIYNYINR